MKITPELAKVAEAAYDKSITGPTVSHAQAIVCAAQAVLDLIPDADVEPLPLGPSQAAQDAWYLIAQGLPMTDARDAMGHLVTTYAAVLRAQADADAIRNQGSNL